MVIPAVEAELQHGTLVMPSSEMSLFDRGGPETFFHKIVMIRKESASSRAEGERERRGYGVPSKLSEADKFDLQQYITRCYGSLTTFNILFKNKDDEFRTGAADTPTG